MSVDVVTLGEVMALMLAPDGVPLDRATSYDAGYAGAESNVAVGLARLGHTVALVSRVGDDTLGHRILRELRGEGVDVDAVTTHPDRPTGLLLRDTLATGVSVAYLRGDSAARTMHRDDLPEATIATARLLHVTGITAAIAGTDVVRAAIALAREAGVTVSFDPNVRTRLAPPARWRDLATEIAGVSDVVLIGTDDARTLGIEDPIVWAHDRGASVVVLKDGARGASESSGGDVVSEPARTVPVVDPVGAGDAFAAGWISGWLRGIEPQQRLAEAAVVAACVVATRGDTPGLPDAARRDRMLTSTTDVTR